MARKHFVFLSGLLLALLPGISVAAADKVVTISESQKHVSTASQQKRYVDYITITPNQERVPLTLTFYNGGDKNPGLTNPQVSLGGRPILSPKDFTANTTAVNLTGKVRSGNTAVQVTGMARPGSTFSWKLTTVVTAPSLSAVEPKEGGVGRKVTLKGDNFSPVRTDNVVEFSGTKAEVVSVDGKSITVKVPDTLRAGEHDVTVSVQQQRSEIAKYKVKVPPVLESLSLISSPPGQPLTISGKNFAPKASDNKVTIGGVECPVESGNTYSLTVTVPELANPQYYVPVMVESDGMKATNYMTIDIQNRVF